MSVFFALCIGLAVNLDNFLIGMNLGVRGQTLPHTTNLAISFTSCLFALLPSALARSLFAPYRNIAEHIGAGLMIFYGLWCLKNALLVGTTDPKSDPRTPSTPLHGWQLLFLSILLAVNCIPPAISAGAFFLPPLAMGFFCFLFSLISLWAGNRLGLRIPACPYTNYLPHISAILLILIGYATWKM